MRFVIVPVVGITLLDITDFFSVYFIKITIEKRKTIERKPISMTHVYKIIASSIPRVIFCINFVQLKWEKKLYINRMASVLGKQGKFQEKSEDFN